MSARDWKTIYDDERVKEVRIVHLQRGQQSLGAKALKGARFKGEMMMSTGPTWTTYGYSPADVLVHFADRITHSNDQGDTRAAQAARKAMGRG